VAADPNVIFEHVRTGNRRLVAQLTEFKGHRFLDLREWMVSGDERTATKKGVTVPLGVIRRLGEALLTASQSDQSEGSSQAA
jgi:hypothetical protein